MPTYLYRCNACNTEEDAWAEVENRDSPRVHTCGNTMRRVFSPLAIVMKQTGREMALNTLNSDSALPDRWYTDKYTRMAAQGLEEPPKRVW